MLPSEIPAGSAQGRASPGAAAALPRLQTQAVKEQQPQSLP